MSRLLFAAAVTVLLPAAARAQLPFYFAEPPGNPALGYRAYDQNPLTPPPVVYRPVVGSGLGPFFVPTVHGGFPEGPPVYAAGYPAYTAGFPSFAAGYPMYTGGYLPTLGSVGYASPAPLTIVIEQVTPPATPVSATAAAPGATTASSLTELSVATAKTPATLTLQFPTAAKVWLDGKEVAGKSGTERTLTSPPLSPGQQHTFKVKAEWAADGTTRTYSRDITVGAGEQTRVVVLGGGAKTK